MPNRHEKYSGAFINVLLYGEQGIKWTNSLSLFLSISFSFSRSFYFSQIGSVCPRLCGWFGIEWIPCVRRTNQPIIHLLHQHTYTHTYIICHRYLLFLFLISIKMRRKKNHHMGFLFIHMHIIYIIHGNMSHHIG